MSEKKWLASYRGKILPGVSFVSDLTRVWDVVLFENLTQDQWERLTFLGAANNLYSYVWREMPSEHDEQGNELLAMWREKANQPF